MRTKSRPCISYRTREGTTKLRSSRFPRQLLTYGPHERDQAHSMSSARSFWNRHNVPTVMGHSSALGQVTPLVCRSEPESAVYRRTSELELHWSSHTRRMHPSPVCMTIVGSMQRTGSEEAIFFFTLFSVLRARCEVIIGKFAYGRYTVEGLLFDFNLQFLCETLCERTAYHCSHISWGEPKGPSCVLEDEVLSCSFSAKRAFSSFFGQAASVVI